MRYFLPCCLSVWVLVSSLPHGFLPHLFPPGDELWVGGVMMGFCFPQLPPEPASLFKLFYGEVEANIGSLGERCWAPFSECLIGSSSLRLASSLSAGQFGPSGGSCSFLGHNVAFAGLVPPLTASAAS